MKTFDRASAAGLVASGLFTLGVFCVTGPAVTQAAPVLNEVMLVNGKTGKCLIAGGVSIENNVHTVQFDCDSDTSRTWTIRLKL